MKFNLSAVLILSLAAVALAAPHPLPVDEKGNMEFKDTLGGKGFNRMLEVPTNIAANMIPDEGIYTYPQQRQLFTDLLSPSIYGVQAPFMLLTYVAGKVQQGAQNVFNDPHNVVVFAENVKDGLQSMVGKVAGKSEEEKAKIIKEELPKELPKIVRAASRKLAQNPSANLDDKSKKALTTFANSTPQGDLRAIIAQAMRTAPTTPPKLNRLFSGEL